MVQGWAYPTSVGRRFPGDMGTCTSIKKHHFHLRGKAVLPTPQAALTARKLILLGIHQVFLSSTSSYKWDFARSVNAST